MLRAVLIALVVLPYAALAAIVGIPWSMLTGSDSILYRLGHFGVRLALRLAGTRIVLEGREHLADVRNTVVISNHESHLDAPVLFEALGADLKAVVKKEIFAWPFLGPVLRRAGFVAVNRRDRIQSGQALSRAAESLRAGTCMLVFAEGTRSRTGELLPFKKGGFVIGIEARSRILPVAVHGGRALMPAEGMRIRAGDVHVRVLDPIETAGYSYSDRDRLAGEVRARIARALEEMRAGKGGAPTAA
jgi:1-acyl-sn-glycerol-3-phosphate acyltransferase